MFLIEYTRKQRSSTIIRLVEFEDNVVDYAGRMYNLLPEKERNLDLLPQATALACLFLGELLLRGKIAVSQLKIAARQFGIEGENIYSRLPHLSSISTCKDIMQATQDNSGLIWVESKYTNFYDLNMIRIPEEKMDACLTMRRSKDLYLTYLTYKPCYPINTPKDADMSNLFYSRYQSTPSSPHPEICKLRMMLLSQAVLFSPTEDLGRYKGEALRLLREFHKFVVPIDKYFQSLVV